MNVFLRYSVYVLQIQKFRFLLRHKYVIIFILSCFSVQLAVSQVILLRLF